MIQLKALSKTENIDGAMALIAFYEVHNVKLEDPLHGELVVEDAMKRIEKKRAKQERKAQFNAGNTWSANPYEEKSEVESEEEKEDAAIPAVKEIPATDADVWRAKPEKTTGVSSKVNQNSLLTDRTDSKILHAKLVKVQTLLLDSRRNMLLSGASFAGGLILIAIEGYAFAAISFIAIPVFAVIAVVKKHNAIRALSSVQ
ncbi:MAG TPA: hypothetical protein DCX00_02570 [Flavobacteriales bacterium]|nr:hypothetical protein [Flavobacteriales bacterium]